MADEVRRQPDDAGLQGFRRGGGFSLLQCILQSAAQTIEQTHGVLLFTTRVDGGDACAATYWYQPPLWMLFVFRCTRTRARGVFLAHVRAVLEISVVLMSGEMIDFRR
jgi:hypothetical protein